MKFFGIEVTRVIGIDDTIQFDGELPHSKERLRDLADIQLALAAVAVKARVNAGKYMPPTQCYHFFNRPDSYDNAGRRLGRTSASRGVTSNGRTIVLESPYHPTDTHGTTHETIHNISQRFAHTTGRRRVLSTVSRGLNEAGTELLAYDVARRLNRLDYEVAYPSLVVIADQLLPEMAVRSRSQTEGSVRNMLHGDVLTGDDETLRLMKQTHGREAVELWAGLNDYDSVENPAGHIRIANALGLTGAAEILTELELGLRPPIIAVELPFL